MYDADLFIYQISNAKVKNKGKFTWTVIINIVFR